MQRNPRSPHHKDVLLPRLNYRQAKRCWFIHGGNIHALDQVSAPVFRAFIKTHRPRKWRNDHACLTILEGRTIDFETKWFVLCSLFDEKITVPLYPSSHAAQQAIQDTDDPKTVVTRSKRKEGV